MTQPEKRSKMRSRRRTLLSFLPIGFISCAGAAELRGKAEEQFSFSTTANSAKETSALLYTAYLREVAAHVDWDMLRDEYAIAAIEEKSGQRKLRRQRYRNARPHPHPKSLISEAIDSALRAGSSSMTAVITDRSNWESSSSEDEKLDSTKSLLDQALDDIDGMMTKADASQRQTADDDLLGLDDDIASPAPSGAPTIRIADTLLPTVRTNTPTAAATNGPTVSPSLPADKEPSPSRPDDDRIMLPDDDEFIGIPIPKYSYNPGTNCQDSGNGVPCAPDDLQDLCNKSSGKFSSCLEACIPSFCCIHDAPPATIAIAPSCSEDLNCAAYAHCYIVWWKFHDTIGPAPKLRLEQSDDFFDLDPTFISGDVTGAAFFQELLFHHFNDSQEIIEAGTVMDSPTSARFDSDLIFLNPDFWDAESAIP